MVRTIGLHENVESLIAGFIAARRSNHAQMLQSGLDIGGRHVQVRHCVDRFRAGLAELRIGVNLHVKAFIVGAVQQRSQGVAKASGTS